MDELTPEQQLREAAWKVFKDLHDGPVLRAAGGWCAPSTITWVGESGVEMIMGPESVIDRITVPRGGLRFP